MSDSAPLLWLGFVGQGFFCSRFVVQWLASERRHASVVPSAFWFLSLVGGALLLTYALQRRDPVFVAGQLGGLFVYGRNLWLIYRPASRTDDLAGRRIGGDALP